MDGWFRMLVFAYLGFSLQAEEILEMILQAPTLRATQRLFVGALLLCVLLAKPLPAASFYPLRPEDSLAVYLEKGAFGVHADGIADDSDALQQAIDRVEATTHQGVVFIPDGRYRLGKTVHVWEGIRLIGYGPQRPVFVLGKDTPGFQEGAGKYMIFFADRKPADGAPVADASEFTFYSGMSNIDFELREGNAAAIAIRFHVAQHGVLSHMDFHLGIGSGRARRHWQSGQRHSYLRWSIWHCHEKDFARVAVSADGFKL